MPADSFTDEVIRQLNWYVYRLIDPRNGETFYVGKGQGNRVFEHVKGAINSDDDEVSDPKIARIKEIQRAGLDVSHVIHRHGMTEQTAYAVEAALIDAYPGSANKAAGHGSDEYGCRHADEIIAQFEAEEFKITERLICINIPHQYYTHSTYDAVRGMWIVNIDKVGHYNLVLAHVRGLVVGAFRPNQPWMAATRENFSAETFPEVLCKRVQDKRRGFEGKEAEDEVWNYYAGKRVPARYFKKGTQNAVRYLDRDTG